MKNFLLPIIIVVLAVHLIFFMLVATTNTNPDEELFNVSEKIENKNTKIVESSHIPDPQMVSTKTNNNQTTINNSSSKNDNNKQTTVNNPPSNNDNNKLTTINNPPPKNDNNNKPKNPSVAEKKEYHEYVIKKGDNLTMVSKKYKIDINTIIKENNMKNSVLWIGKKLKIPKTSENNHIN